MEDQKAFTDDLIRAGEFVQTFLSKNAIVTLPVYQKFWSTLPYKANPSLYLTCLITKLCALETGDDRNMSLVEMITRITTDSTDTSSTNDDPRQVNQMKESLLVTIYMVNLFFNTDPSYPPLKNAISRWSSLQSKAKPLDFVSELLNQLSVSGYLESDNCINILVEQSSNIESCIELSDSNSISFNAQQLTSGLAYTYLLDCVMRGKHLKAVWQSIIKFIKHRNVSPKRLLSLLLIMRSVLYTCPCFDVGLLELGLNSIKEYYQWPSPIGDIVRDCLYLLSLELQLPGYCFRSRLFSENPQIFSSVPTSERNIHLLLDETSRDGKVLQEIVRAEFEEELSVPELQTDLLANIFERFLEVSRDTLGLEYLSRDDTRALFKTACDILNNSLTMSDEEAILYRYTELQELREQIISKVTPRRRKSIELFTTIPKIPRLPSLSFQFFNAKCDNIEPLQLEINKFPHRNTVAVLTHIMNQYLMSISNEEKGKKEIKIGIMGGNALIHNITCSYSVLRLNQPKYFDFLDIKFYLIPTEESTLSRYISQRDPWYHRQLQLLLSCMMKVYPTVSINPGVVPIPPAFSNDSNPEKPKLGGITASNSFSYPSSFEELSEQFQYYEQLKPRKYLSPSLVLRREVERYFRDANELFRVNVFQCECWADDKVDSSYIIPFFSRAELGLNAQTRAFQLSPVSSSLTESQVSKYFKYTPPILSVKFSIASSRTIGGNSGSTLVSKAGPPIEIKAYYSIIISNLPQSDDPFPVPPNPGDGWLEACLIEAEFQKRRKVRSDDGRIYHVNTIEIATEDKKKFEVLLDGELYGPFSKIRIGACTQEDEQVFVPIMTYFPLNNSLGPSQPAGPSY